MSSPLSHLPSRVLTAAVAALGVTVSVLAAPAHAVRPPNDDVSGAAEITSIPAEIETDTRRATRDRPRRDCVFGRSVWYRYRPTESGRVKMVTIGSSFDTVLAVYAGGRTPQTLLACNDDAVNVASAVRPRLEAGRRHWIAVSSCCGGQAPGGDLVLRVYRGGTRGVEMSLDSAESGTISGRIRIQGTVSCATPSVAFGRVSVSQRVGDQVARGRGSIRVRECLSETAGWVVRIDSRTGTAFQPGMVAVEGFLEGFDGFSRATTSVEDNLPVTEDPLGRVVH